MGEGIISTIGGTPLIQLKRIMGDSSFRLFAKMESFNAGGSVKDRAAITIIEKAMQEDQIHAGSTIIESSSGNMGIGLAQACAYFGLRFICVVDPKTTQQNIKILEAYGAEVDMVKEPSPVTGEFLQARLDRVQFLLTTVENAFWTDQYANTYNALAHHNTMREIVAALDGKVDYLFTATSTCGTIRGCREYLREAGLPTKIVAVDAVGSVIFGENTCKRLIPGHGAAVRPKLYQDNLADLCVLVTDLDCVVECRRLMKREAILAGGSSGAVTMAVRKLKREIERDAVCVMILPDRGERYLDTIYCDSWVKEHFGDISSMWQE
jgi:N-(2-amino-2-carboxyethyl)-L-glutamate synthase